MNEDDLPSLNAIQSFVAAARHLNFSEAAKALFVSPGAVSRMVRQLETELQVELLRRNGRTLELTERGAVFYAEVAPAFARIASAARTVRGMEGGNILSLAVLPTFALRCLLPRLHLFQNENPDIFIDMMTRDADTDVLSESTDVSICIGNGNWANAEATLICAEHVGVYCAPTFLPDGVMLREVGDLSHYRLLTHSTRPDAWGLYFAAFALPAPNLTQSPRFEHNFMVLEAAAAGLGMALLPTFLAEDEVAKGRLVQVLPDTVKSRDSYYAVTGTISSTRRKVRRFIRWLVENCST